MKRFVHDASSSPTIKDVAKLTGLSIGTISKYLNGGHVLDENRAAIERAIKDLHFEVNQVARGLKKNRTMLIGLLVSTYEGQFQMRMISNIERSLMKCGYSTIVCDYQNDYKLEAERIRFFIGRKVDGIIVIPTVHNNALYEEVLAKGISLIFIDRPLDAITCDCVLVNNREATREATEVLIKKGHKRIAMLNMHEPDGYTGSERQTGYVDALKGAGLPIDPRVLVADAITIAGGYSGMMRLLDLKPRPSAVIVPNDDMAFGALKALGERNVRVPEEMAIIGFDAFELATVFKPELSVVQQPIGAIGDMVAEVMLKRLSGRASFSPMRIELKMQLILRGSSGI
jgi:DNA-binding LacI/PurR family transcriptional regulator